MGQECIFFDEVRLVSWFYTLAKHQAPQKALAYPLAFSWVEERGKKINEELMSCGLGGNTLRAKQVQI